MDKTRMSLLVLLTLLISSISMGIFAFNFFSADDIGFAIMFTVLCVFLLSAPIYGFMRDRSKS